MDDPHGRVERLVWRFLDHVRHHEPVAATRIGLDGEDGRLPDLSPGALAERSRDLSVLTAEVAATLEELGDPDHEDRSTAERRRAMREARGDLLLLREELEYRRFRLDVRPRFLLDPSAALDLVGSAIHELLGWDDGTHGDRCRRLEAAVQRARRIPVLLEQAGGLLASASAPDLEVAFERLPGLLDLMREVLPRWAERLGVDVSPARDAGEVAAEALEAYAALLDELRDDPPADWRLGPEQHATTLRTSLGTVMRPAQIEDRARTWLNDVRARLADLAGSDWSARFTGVAVPADHDQRIRAVLDDVAASAVHRDELVPEACRALEEARAFAQTQGLTDVPPAWRLRIREVPAYLRGLAVAFVTQPPPLRPAEGCTFYLSPIPAGWDDATAGRFLAEYTPAALRSLAVHEGYPGHVVQLEHAAQHPRLARRLVSRPVFAEGWAVHIERQVAAAGFGDGESSSVRGEDYRVVQLRNELQIAAGALIDVGLHAGSLADGEAVDLLSTSTFQGRDEAANLVRRAQVAPGQMATYFVGGEELTDLRTEVRAREGASFDERRFHQRVLSHGTPSVALLREALAAEHAEVRRPFAVGA